MPSLVPFLKKIEQGASRAASNVERLVGATHADPPLPTPTHQAPSVPLSQFVSRVGGTWQPATPVRDTQAAPLPIAPSPAPMPHFTDNRLAQPHGDFLDEGNQHFVQMANGNKIPLSQIRQQELRAPDPNVGNINRSLDPTAHGWGTSHVIQLQNPQLKPSAKQPIRYTI